MRAGALLKGDSMSSFKLAKPILAALTACAVNFALGGAVLADTAQDNAQLKEQMRIMMQQMQEMQKQIQQLKQQQQQPPQPAATPPVAPKAPAPSVGPEEKAKVAKAPPEPAFEKFAKGFYGTLDVSADYATKGMSELGRLSLVVRRSHESRVWVTCKEAKKSDRWVAWAGRRICRRTNPCLGYRGSHKIPDTTVDFIYQIEVQPAITSAPGASTGYTAQSNVTKSGIGYGDSFVGVQNAELG